MLYEVTFYCNQIACANLVESDAMWNGKEYFIQEVLQGDESRFIGISVQISPHRCANFV